MLHIGWKERTTNYITIMSKKKVIITGGTGTVGMSFIEAFYSNYEFYSISRNEANIAELKKKFPSVKSFIADITNLDSLISIFEKVKPDLVIHSAALKHIDLAEENPSTAVEVNVVGSLNVVKASIRAEVPVTVGVSTDKACEPTSVYGYTKSIMEKIFAEHHNPKTKFVCTRFANVAGSAGSVIPFWKSLAEKGLPLRLTHPDMNRLMFSQSKAASLVHTAYINALKRSETFTLSCIMKNVNMLDLANTISDKEVKIVGLRPGEKLNERLVSVKELPYTYVRDGLIFILKEEQDREYNLKEEHSSLTAENMNKEEIKQLL